MLFGLSFRLNDFLHILTSKMHPPNHANIDFGSFSRRFGIDLVLQGRIWMDSERLGLDFSLIWCIFEWIERGFCKQSLDEQYALVSALNMALLLSHCIFSLTSGAAGCASRLRRLPQGCNAC